MFIKDLYDLKKEPLHLEPKEVAFEVHLSREGKYLTLLRTQGEEQKPEAPPFKPAASKKPGSSRARSKVMLVPWIPTRSSNVDPRFLVDNGGYVLGLSDKSTERAEKYHKAFVERIEKAHKETGHPMLKAVLSFFASKDDRKLLLDDLKKDVRFSPEFDHFTFRVDGNLILEDEALLEWRRKEIVEILRPKCDEGTCIVTGEKGLLARTLPKIKGIPGTRLGMGAALVMLQPNGSPNALISRGRLAGNSPIGLEVGIGAVKSLNWLIKDPAHHVKLSESSMAVFWPRADIPDEGIADAIARALREGERESLKKFFLSVQSGKLVIPDDPFGFSILCLAGRGSSVSVMSYERMPIAAAVERLNAFFDALYADGTQYGNYGLWHIIGALAPRGDLKKIPPDWPKAIFETAIFGRPLSPAIQSTAIKRYSIAKRTEKSETSKEPYHLSRQAIRIGLIRIFERRNGMDPTKSPGYLLGRLFSEYENAQRKAITSIGADIGARYFDTALSRPKMAFFELARGFEAHQRKIARRNPGLGVRIRKRVGEILSSLDPRDPFPAILSQEEKGRFILGRNMQNQSQYKKPEVTVVEEPETQKEESHV